MHNFNSELSMVTSRFGQSPMQYNIIDIGVCIMVLYITIYYDIIN